MGYTVFPILKKPKALSDMCIYFFKKYLLGTHNILALLQIPEMYQQK